MIMKRAAKISLALIVMVTVLLIFSAGFISEEKKYAQPSLSYSKDFQYLYFILTSQKVDSIEIQKSISQLNNPFVKDLANALLLKRKQKFEEAFLLLEKHFNKFPKDFRFYEELVLLSLINNKSDEIEKKLNNNSSNKYTDYLKALLAYHKSDYTNAINLLSEIKDPEALLLLSHCYRAIGDYQKALIFIDSCLNIYPKEKPDYCRIIISKGSLFLLSGKTEEANRLYKIGYDLATANNNRKEEAKALINLAIIDDYNGKTDEAQKKLKLALNLANAIEDIELKATVYSETGVSYTYSGDIVEARKNYEKSFELFSKLKNSERLANLSANIGSLYIQTANFSAAIKSFEEGLKFAGENAVSRILNLRGLGDVYSNLSDYSRALEYYNGAKELSEKIRNVTQKAISQMSIGTLYYNLQRPKSALSVFRQVSEEITESEDPYLTEELLFKLAIAYSDLDSFIIAEDYFRKATAVAESISDRYYESLITTYFAYNFIRQNKYSQAEALLNKAKKTAFEHGFTHLTTVQNLYLGISRFNQRKFNDAKIFLAEADKSAISSNDFNNSIESKYYYALCLEREGKITEAEKKYTEAIEQIEKSSSTSLLNSLAEVYRFAGLKDSYLQLTNLYLSQSKFKEAFNLIEKFRARNTYSNLNELKIQNYVNDENLLRSYYDTKWKINSGIFSESEKDSLEKIFNSIKKDLIAKHNVNPDYEKENFNLDTDLDKIPENETIVSYYFSEENCFAFVIKRNSFNPIQLSGQKNEILNLVKKISPVYESQIRMDNAYYNQDLFSFNSKAANQLYKSLFDPIREFIPSSGRIIFSLPVELSIVPMEFLVTEFDSFDSPYYYNNKKFLVENYSVSYTPSVSIYLLQKEKPVVENENLLLVGDPKITDSDFAQSFRGSLIDDQSFNSRSLRLFPLKFSREEVEQIESMFSDASVLLSEDATEEQFIKNSSGKALIHLSTHSFIHNEQPFIIFSQEEKSDANGYLEAGEIVKLKLNSELVVLSSCKSGLGTIDATEGVIGMQKSFFEAGAKSVIVSLWDVNDKYTAFFMKSFYKYLSEGYDKSDALRKAKIFFKENYSANPYYWAAFVLAGDNSALKFIKPNSFSLKYSVIVLTILLLFYLSFRFYSNRSR